jgi:tRNA pseudouridine32 synthase/23S rRNA pseudouridine746 synthase
VTEIRPSRLYLPKREDSPPTILEYLLRHFPQVDPGIWRERVSRGSITLSDGTTLEESSPYRHGLMVFYRKEVAAEPAAPEDPLVIYRDDEIMVVDKPHGMPVIPAGQYLERSLLVRLQNDTGVFDLAPIHRLDRDTAGLLMFSIRPETRPHYHRLFAEGIIEREYVAVSHVGRSPDRKSWRIESRIEPGSPWYWQKTVEGPVNAITAIELDETGDGAARFRLYPKTGKKHQLRVHMTSIGFPIAGDPFYPAIREKEDGEPPLQLLAWRLAFTDPLTGAPRAFESTRKLLSFS